MTQEEAKKLKRGDTVLFAGSPYNVADIRENPFGIGVMVGIFDEPPSKHVDYLQPKSVEKLLPYE